MKSYESLDFLSEVPTREEYQDAGEAMGMLFAARILPRKLGFSLTEEEADTCARLGRIVGAHVFDLGESLNLDSFVAGCVELTKPLGS